MLEWIPDRPALSKDQSSSVDVLIRLSPPLPTGSQERLAINVALVIDNSGSMTGQRLQLTKRAAILVAKSLTPKDRLSVVLFNNTVSVLLSNTPVVDPSGIVRLLEGVSAGGSTALFDGWKQGAEQASLGQSQQNLNRVILLTDGQANVGETNPDAICNQVHQFGRQGLQTTTMGFGRDYNEQLLRSMAASGEGNHFFVETPEQIEKFFELELEGLTATLGTRVRLKLRPLHPDLGVEPLGEVQLGEDDDFVLSDLVAGFPLEQLFRLSVPVTEGDAPVIEAELNWYDPSLARSMIQVFPLTLPRLDHQQRLALPLHPEVEKQLAIAMAARARREATAAAQRGNAGEATQLLDKALESAALPDFDKAQLRQLKLTLERGDMSAASKQSMALSHSYSRGSIVMGNIDGLYFEGLLDSLVPLKRDPMFSKPLYERTRPQDRLEGALAGMMAASQYSGEFFELAMATLRSVNGSNKLMQTLPTLQEAWAQAPIANASAAHVAFVNRQASGYRLFECAVEAPEAGALVRSLPLLLARWNQPSTTSWGFVILGAQLTHNDDMAAAANVAYTKLLLKLMAASAAPAPGSYLDYVYRKLKLIETAREYSPRAPRFDGWHGPLSEFLASVIPEARRRSLSFSEAVAEWGSSPYLLEMMPTLLYLLECHGHQPRVALEQATHGPHASPLLAALAGAALGALHGVMPGCEPQGELQQILDRLSP